MQKWKECGVCGGDSYRIKSDNSLICADCGARVGWYSDGQVPPSSVLNRPELKAAYMDVFEGRTPTDEELNLIEAELSDDFTRIAEEIADATRKLQRTGELPLG